MKTTLALLAALAAFATPAFAQEQVQPFEHLASFQSDITVHEDRTVSVTETIVAYANDESIVHGIYRDFPTIYTDAYGNTYRIGFTLVGVLMNAAAEPYHTAQLSNGIRIYIGDPDMILTPGFYTYEIRYTATRELGFFSDHDSLFWNVTGNGWSFPIDHASATVHLPAAIPLDAVTTTAYTGASGSMEHAYEGSTTPDSVAFTTTRPLDAFEGFSIMVNWPKGYIAPPTRFEILRDFLLDNWIYLVGGIIALLMLAYYLRAWWQHGRDPRPGTIIAQYDPPGGLSPAAIRYIDKQGYDNKALTAAIINLAVKSALRIEELPKHLLQKTAYRLTRMAQPGTLSEDEKIVLDAVFKDGEVFEPSGTHYQALLSASTMQKALFDKTYKNVYFTFHAELHRIPIAVTVLTFIAGVVAAVLNLDAYIIRIGGFFCLYAASIAVFYYLLLQRTPEGRRLEDEIQGFKLFLSVTEKDRLNFFNPPERTPELFEKFLPYALALGVENKWAEQFTATFAALDARGNHYQPMWYVGSFSSNNVGGFTSSIGTTFAGAIAASSSPPGSSSGGGSGGGGGGGGGGGW